MLKAKIIIVAVLVVFFLASCAAPLGTIHVYKVGEDNTFQPPLQSMSSVGKDKAIYQTNEKTSQSGDDVFSIYLTDIYLRFLRDLGGISEVVIVAEFTEIVTGDTEKDRVVKVLGPYKNIADATKAPLLNKLIYGPKRMESDVLSLNLKVYEYDEEENQNNAAMLDFIAASSQSLGLADPATRSQMTAAKEVAKALFAANENDLVLEMDMDFVAGQDSFKAVSNKNVDVLPLQAGELLFIKQEACRPGTCYEYFTDADDKTNPIAWLANGVMMVPVATVRALSDVPDNAALAEIDIKGLAVTNDVITIADSKVYKDKTWLRLAVLKGGNPDRWEKRKIINALNDGLAELITANKEIDSSVLVAMNAQATKAVKELEAKSSELLKLSSLYAQDNVQFIRTDNLAPAICVAHQSHVILDAASVRFTSAAGALPVTTVTSPVGQMCFNLGSANTALIKGNYSFQINFNVNDQAQSKIYLVKAVDLPVVGAASVVCDRAKSERTLNIQVVDTDNLLTGITVSGVGKEFTLKSNKLVVVNPVIGTPDSLAFTINTQVGDVNWNQVSVSACP